MDDDFNTAGAMGHLFELVRATNQARATGIEKTSLKGAQDLLLELTRVLGLRLIAPSAESSQASKFVDLLVEIRSELRQQKLWALSDLVRHRLTELGVILEDGKGGTTWRWG
jgi:cysteinyl-tRNA synthetase